MKEWIKRWLGTEKPSAQDFNDLLATAIETLGKAQAAHISDLRVLIDKGHEREAHLAKMVELAMEHQFYRPAIRAGEHAENKLTPAIAMEHLQDVEVFDPAEDAETVKAHEAELSALIAEQNAHGTHKVGG